MNQMLVIANHCIEDNFAGNFTLTGEVDPITGANKIVAIPRVTNPGDWVEFPEDFARQLIASEAVREPTDQELALRRLASGGSQ